MRTANYAIDDTPAYVKYAIFECLMSFKPLTFILTKIKYGVKRNSVKKLSTIWEDPYM